MMKKLMAGLISASVLISGMTTPASVSAAETAHTDYNSQIMNRGLVAMQTAEGIYLSWRLNPEEDAIFGSAENNVSFDIYRNGELIATEADSTNFLDTQGNASSQYTVQPIADDGTKGNMSESVTAFASGSNYFDIPLVLPEPYTITYKNSSGKEVSEGPLSFTPSDASTGDLDGDGVYDIVVKYTCRELDVGKAGYSGVTKLAAYKLDGTKMWENDIDLGRNVYSSAHTVQFLVYDFDEDGKAEITCQTAPGSLDAKGQYVSNASLDETISALTDEQNAAADYRAVDNGRITSGPEYLTVFSGETGEAIDTINYPTQRHNLVCWGKEDGGNRSLRFLADVAYLDGEKPYAVYWRGYYDHDTGRTGIAGVSFNGKHLKVDYTFDTLSGQTGYTSGNALYAGEGNHNLSVADVDGDGKDEVLSGALCMGVNDSGKLMPEWCTFRGHGDALHIGDYDPTHDGYEFFTVHEEGDGVVQGITLDYGCSVIDAATGEILFHEGAGSDTGRGMMANVGAGGYYQIICSGNGPYIAKGNGVFEAARVRGMSQNFRIFWDGDLYDELLDKTKIASWNGREMATIFTAEGCKDINSTKANPSLSADILGDWREEVIYPLSDSSALRVFTTNIKTEFKMKTLMSDGMYRSGVAAEQTTYNQPPHIGYYVDLESFKGEAESINIAGMPSKLQYYVGDELDTTGLVITALYSDGTQAEVSAYDVEGFDSMQAGKQTITVDYKGKTAEFTVEVISGLKINADGMINGWSATGETRVTVPESIDGTAVKGFAGGALMSAQIEKLYIYDISLEFANADIFADGITLYGYTSSTAQAYAAAHNTLWTALDAPINQSVTFDEEFYSKYANSSMLIQSSAEGVLADNVVTYRTTAMWYPLENTSYGFHIARDNRSNQYLSVCSGLYFDGFLTDNQVYMVTNETHSLKDTASGVISMDICFPTDTNSPFIELQDGQNIIDVVSVADCGLENDKWYRYSLEYKNGAYTRTIYKADGSVHSKTKLTSIPGGDFVNTIAYKQTYVWGNDLSTKAGIIYVDNISIDVTAAATATFNVTDTAGNAVKNAVVYIDGGEYKTSDNGSVVALVKKGSHTVAISANGYVTKSIDTDILENKQINVMLEPKENVSVEVVVRDYASGVITDAAYNGMRMLQGKELASTTIGDITYAVNARAAGGDSTTGFTQKKTGTDTYLMVGAGEFNTANRNAYMTFDNAPALANVETCIFTTDIYFVGGNTYDMTVKISDGSSVVSTFDVNVSEKLATNTWYTYSLTYSEGKFVESFTDSQGSVVYTNTVSSTAKSISRIDFTAPGKKAEVYMKNISLSVPTEYEVSENVASDDKYSVVIHKSNDAVRAVVTTADEVAKLRLISAAYDKAGNLTAVSLSPITMTDGEYTAEIERQYGEVSKIMLWNEYTPVINVQ